MRHVNLHSRCVLNAGSKVNNYAIRIIFFPPYAKEIEKDRLICINLSYIPERQWKNHNSKGLTNSSMKIYFITGRITQEREVSNIIKDKDSKGP